ncbi:MAG: peptidoglycan DD-metalloendopeptidase family protein [Anaerolineae bacterium]
MTKRTLFAISICASLTSIVLVTSQATTLLAELPKATSMPIQPYPAHPSFHIISSPDNHLFEETQFSTSQDVGFTAPAISAEIIDDYLRHKDSPLVGHGQIFVDKGRQYNIDPRLLVAIAGAETSFGKRLCTPYNAWNWFYTGRWCDAPFGSWDEGIDRVNEGLKRLYFNGGLDGTIRNTIPLIGERYCPGCTNWVSNVTFFYQTELGGDVNNLIFAGSPPTPPKFLTLPFDQSSGVSLPDNKPGQGWWYWWPSIGCYDHSPDPGGYQCSGTCCHKGIDYWRADGKGFTVRASAAGYAKFYGGSSSWGNTVYIRHPIGGYNWYTLYAHLNQSYIPNDNQEHYVSRGDAIGYAGKTGAANDWVHLHFELSRDWIGSTYRVDPYGVYATYNYYPFPPSGQSSAWTTDPPSYPGGGICSAPTLREPSNDATVRSREVTFRWDAPSSCPGLDVYTVRVVDDPNKIDSGPWYRDGGVDAPTTSKTYTFDRDGDFWWAVWPCRGCHSGNPNYGDRSAVWHFRIDTSQPSCNPSADQIALFVDADYHGQCVVKGIGEYPDSGSIGLPNDSISSIKVGANVRAILCRDNGYGGCETFTNDDPNLSDNTIGNDSVSSVKVERRTCNYTADQVILYSGTWYGGNCVTLGIGDYPDPGHLGAVGNDNTRSIRVGSNVQATLYENSGYNGRQDTFTSDDPDLADNNIRYDTSSVKVQRRSCNIPSPSSPCNGTRISQTSNVNFSWSGNCSQYRVKYWGGPYSGDLYSPWVNGSSWSIGLWCGNYSWQVQGKSSSGVETGWSSTCSFSVVPATPTGLTASAASPSQINLSWNDPGGEKDGYKVYYSNGSYIGSTSSTSYQVTGLNCSTNYCFYVTAYKGSLESNQSDSRCATTQACPPTCPDPYEPNNSFSSAWRVTPGTYQSYICCGAGTDLDYFTFYANSGDRIEIWLSNLPYDYDICLYNPGQSQIGCSAAGSTSNEYIAHTAQQTGDYYIKIYGFSGACSSSSPYTLRLALSSPTRTPTLPTPTATRTRTPTPTFTRASTLVHTPTATCTQIPGLSQEAENGRIMSPMTTGYDATASGGRYVYSPQSYAGYTDLSFYISQEANYNIWGRVSADSYGTDSFWVTVDGGPEALWDIPIGPWVWVPVTHRTNSGSTLTQIYRLTSGLHQIRVRAREAGARLDILELRYATSNPNTPTKHFLYLPAIIKR